MRGLVVFAALLAGTTGARAQFIHLVVDGVITEKTGGANWGMGVGDPFQVNLWFGAPREDLNRWRLWGEGNVDVFERLTFRSPPGDDELTLNFHDPVFRFAFEFNAKFVEPWLKRTVPFPELAEPADVFLDYYSDALYPVGGLDQGTLRGEAVNIRAELDFTAVPEPSTFAMAALGMLAGAVILRRRRRGA